MTNYSPINEQVSPEACNNIELSSNFTLENVNALLEFESMKD